MAKSPSLYFSLVRKNEGVKPGPLSGRLPTCALAIKYCSYASSELVGERSTLSCSAGVNSARIAFATFIAMAACP